MVDRSAPLHLAHPEPVLEVRDLTVRAGRHTLLRRIDFQVPRYRVLALLGSSGAGKTTLLRCLNRLAELSAGLRVQGQVCLCAEPLYPASGVAGMDPDRLRARIGMLFQQPVVFPGSIRRNVLFGLLHSDRRPARRQRDEIVEKVLCQVALWDEVKERLGEPAATLSVGQQQRLCLARALALDPEVILMDEPTGALDPAATRAIEELIRRLRGERTLILVTHDPAQARRVADLVGIVARRGGVNGARGEEAGELVELAPTETLFTEPRTPEARHFLHPGSDLDPEALADSPTHRPLSTLPKETSR